MRKTYDFSNARQGVHHKQYREGRSLVEIGEGEAAASPVVAVLEPDVAIAFPDSKAVNEALRLVMKLAKAS